MTRFQRAKSDRLLGDRVVMEEPCYLMARRTFESVGAQILATPVDAQGLDTSALPETLCALAYVTPSHQFPLGSVMSISRRQALLAWAQRQLSWLIEDDYDSEFRYGLRPVDPLQSLDADGCVIYIGTFSKALSPQLRLGYLVLPPVLVTPFRHAKQLADRHSPMLEQAVLAEFIRSGAYERHVRRHKRENERRRSALMEAISTHLGQRARVEGTDSGLHVVVWTQDIPMRSEQKIVAMAKEQGGWHLACLTPLRRGKQVSQRTMRRLRVGLCEPQKERHRPRHQASCRCHTSPLGQGCGYSRLKSPQKA
jgi:GntR family transcriptional regulator/MocR family aminotransferase